MPPKQFVTPPNLPEDVVCRILEIPNSKEWLGIFNSALLDLLNQYEYLQVNDTDLTIEETIAKCHDIIYAYFDTGVCGEGDACLLPNGSRVLRLGAGGAIEELGAGVWQAPTGEYAIPPTPARTEPTAAERRCLAAANAENVLAQVYETVSDMVAAEASENEIMVAIALLLSDLLFVAFGFVLPALIPLIFAAWLAFLAMAQFMTEDLWDTEFSRKLRCILLECATDNAGVVTFDFNCVNEELAAVTDPFQPSVVNEVRLFGQVWFILQIIGADGLNAAGATTQVEFWDCDECDDCVDYKDPMVYGFGPKTWLVSVERPLGYNTGSTPSTLVSGMGVNGGYAVKATVQVGSQWNGDLVVDLGGECNGVSGDIQYRAQYVSAGGGAGTIYANMYDETLTVVGSTISFSLNAAGRWTTTFNTLSIGPRNGVRYIVFTAVSNVGASGVLNQLLLAYPRITA